jgi:hypothetical protein
MACSLERKKGRGPWISPPLTCTNLIIRLKILLKKLPPVEPLEFIVRRDQREAIEEPFARAGYGVTVLKIDKNRFRVKMEREEAGSL